jgi:hypothetical protein
MEETSAERLDCSRERDAVIVIYFTIFDCPMAYLFDRWRWSFPTAGFWKYPNSSGKSVCNQAV